MQCPKCKSDNPDDSKFCKECGTQLMPSKEVPEEIKAEVNAVRKIFLTKLSLIDTIQTQGLGKTLEVI